MAKASRDKGVRGEREVVRLAGAFGLTAQRTAALQAAGKRIPGAADVTIAELPGLHLEVKRDERLSVDRMVDQAEADAGDREPVVVYRRNGQPWRAVVPL